MQKLFKALLIVFALCLSLGCAAAASGDDVLTVHFLDVGQADAAILQCGDVSVMIDGGNSADSSLVYSCLTQTLGLSPYRRDDRHASARGSCGRPFRRA